MPNFDIPQIATSQSGTEKETDENAMSTNEPVDDANAVERKIKALESAVVFLLMSRFDNHQSDMLHRVKSQIAQEYKTYRVGEPYVKALALFTTNEIIPTPFPGQDALEANPALSTATHVNPTIAEFFVEQLRKRVVQHNIRVVAKYYKRIQSQRLSQILTLSLSDLETYLSELSSDGDLYLKIDRPAGIISFLEPQQPEQILSEWSSDVSKMMMLMESTCHLINRENMVYKA